MQTILKNALVVQLDSPDSYRGDFGQKIKWKYSFETKGKTENAPIAQLDRALDFGSRG